MSLPSNRLMGPHAAGMDHDIYPFSAIDRRPAMVLPGGARVALFVVLHLEYWELDPPEDAHRDPRFRNPFGNFSPEYHSWSYREYGARVGIFRLLDVLAEFGITASVALNAMAAERYAPLVARLREAGHEPVAHGIAATRMLTGRMTEAEERAHILESRDRLAAVWGEVPEGWHGQDYGATGRTSRILAEEGFGYTLDWANDEQPYWHNPGRSLVAVPAQAEWDDVQAIWLRKVPLTRFPGLVGEAAARLATEASPRVLGVGLHPWMMGAAHRIRYVREALAAALAVPGVQASTAGRIAAGFRQGA